MENEFKYRVSASVGLKDLIRSYRGDETESARDAKVDYFCLSEIPGGKVSIQRKPKEGKWEDIDICELSKIADAEGGGAISRCRGDK